MKNNIEGIILDYGGTLDSNGVHWAHIIWDAYRQAEVPVTENQFREAYVFAERYLAQHKVILPDFNFYDLMEAKVKIEMDYLIENKILVPDDSFSEQVQKIARICYESAKGHVFCSAETIRKLFGKYPIVLVSNFYGNVEAVLKDFNIADFFNSVIESAVVKIRKPDPAIFQLGVDALGLNPENVVVVGDSYVKDIVPGKHCGCQTIWIKGKGWEKEEKENDLSSADHTVFNFSDIENILLNNS
jgi:putative hydrolase of the HAD superfamily